MVFITTSVGNEDQHMDWTMFWQPVGLSVRVAFIGSIIAAIVGTAAAWKMTRCSARGKVLLETLFMLPLVLPPSVVGFLLLVLLGRNSWIGRTIEWVAGAPILFTWWAAVIASVVVAFPLVYQTMKNGFASVERSLQDAARSDGANELQVFRYITTPLAIRSFATAYLLGFARGLGEFGATLMIAGNIPGKTQTISTAVYIAMDTGNIAMAWAWTLSIVMISFLLLLLIRQGQK